MKNESKRLLIFVQIILTCLFGSKAYSFNKTNPIQANILKSNLGCGIFSFSYILSTNRVSVNKSATVYYIEENPQSNSYQVYSDTIVNTHKFINGGWYRIRLHFQTLPNDSNQIFEKEIWDSVFVQERVRVILKSQKCITNGIELKFGAYNGISFGGNGYKYELFEGKFGSNNLIRKLSFDSTFKIAANYSQQGRNFCVIVQDLYGCRDSIEINIPKEEILALNPLKNYDFCSSELDSISVVKHDSIEQISAWFYDKQIIDSNNLKIMPLGAGYYFVKRSLNESCFVIDTIKVMHSEPFTFSLNKIFKDSCEGNIRLSSKSNNNYKYQWFKDFEGLKEQRDSIFYPNKSGLYFLQIIDEGLCSHFSDSIKLNVYPIPNKLEVSGVIFEIDTGIIYQYSLPYQNNLKYQWIPTNADAKSALDSNILLLKFNKYGSALLQVYYTNEHSCSNHSSLPIFVNGNHVGLNNNFEEFKIDIFPNPVNDFLNISIKKSLKINPKFINIYNQTGILVYTDKISEHEFQIPVKEILSLGLHVIEVIDENQSILYQGKFLIDNSLN